MTSQVFLEQACWSNIKLFQSGINVKCFINAVTKA